MDRVVVSKCHETLQLEREILHLIIAIERFDAIWPSIKNRDGLALSYLHVGKIKPDFKQSLLSALTFATDIEPNIFGKYEDLMFEYDTESGIPRLVKCIVVVYKIYIMLKGGSWGFIV